MKVVVCTLLFTFVSLLNSIEVSSQGAECSTARWGNHHVIHLPNQPLDYLYILPNGNVYPSHGTGPILVYYYPVVKLARVHQPGVPDVLLGPGPYGEHHTQELPLVHMGPVPRRIPPNN